MIEHVLLDMDGVLTDFQAAALGVFGYRIVGESVEGMILRGDDGDEITYPFGLWEIPKVLGVSANEFWTKLHEAGDSFFATLPRTPDIDAIFEIIRRRNLPFHICTSPSLDSRDATAKINWMRAYLGDQSFGDYMVGKDKWLMGYNPNALLIDDSPTNCHKFREKGGQAYLWPQYWNSAHEFRNDRLRSLELMLDSGEST